MVCATWDKITLPKLFGYAQTHRMLQFRRIQSVLSLPCAGHRNRHQVRSLVISDRYKKPLSSLSLVLANVGGRLWGLFEVHETPIPLATLPAFVSLGLRGTPAVFPAPGVNRPYNASPYPGLCRFHEQAAIVRCAQAILHLCTITEDDEASMTKVHCRITDKNVRLPQFIDDSVAGTPMVFSYTVSHHIFSRIWYCCTTLSVH